MKKHVVFGDGEFKKSTLSNYPWVKACVQVARREDAIGVRNSRDPDKVTLCFTPEEWKAFIEGVKIGEFDI